MSEKLKDIIDKLAEPLRKLKRGTSGQSIEEDRYALLLDLNDIRERTSLDEHNVLGHSCYRAAASLYSELEIGKSIADMEDHYFIALEGEGKRIAAAIAAGKRETTQQGTVTIQVPEVQNKPIAQPEEKKKGGIFHRGS